MSLSLPEHQLKEHFEGMDALASKAKRIADDIRKAKEEGKAVVFFTGAGISTAAKIPDYRGPNGVWTRRDKGLPPPKSCGLDGAQATYSHRVIKAMLDKNIADYVVSQNVDCLHLKSGVPEEKISELHGNAFKETCINCRTSYLREFSVQKRKGPHFKGVRDSRSQSGISHITGRVCDPCRKKGKEGMLRDSVIHFGESLPQGALEKAAQWCSRAGVVLCIGSSLHVTPAADLPEMCEEVDGRVHIVNLQETDRDELAEQTGGCIVHGKCDGVMHMIASHLGIDCGTPPMEVDDHKEEASKKDDAKASTGKPNATTASSKRDAAGTPKKQRAPTTEASSQEQPQQSRHPGGLEFFTDLGLPTRMSQLPDHLRLTWEMLGTGGEDNDGDAGDGARVRFAVSCPKEYQLPLGDVVQSVAVMSEEREEQIEAQCAADTRAINVDVPLSWWADGETTAQVAVRLDPALQLEEAPSPIAIAVSDKGVAVRPSASSQAGDANPSRKSDKALRIKMPQLRMNPNFTDRLAMAASTLRAAETRVRHLDGSSHVEKVQRG